MGSCSCQLWILVSIFRTKMSDDTTGDCGGGYSGGGGYDSSCGATDSSYHHDSCHYDPSPCNPSHNNEDCHSTGQGIFNDDDGNINSNTPHWENESSNTPHWESESSNTPPWKSKDTYSMNRQTKAEVEQDYCCCTLIWSELCIIA